MIDLRPKRHVTDLLFILALFCVFAASAFLAVIMGVNVYRSATSHMDENYALRTSFSYLTEKLRQNDAAGAIALERWQDMDLLKLTPDPGAVTYIYAQDGELRELAATQTLPFDPKDGVKIMDVEQFSIREAKAGLYQIAITDSYGTSLELFVAMRSGGA